MTLRYDEMGQRLKAFRMGSGLTAEEIAQRMSISRTALYRFEKGELAKIEVLEKLSELLNVSVPTLLGVGTEYIASAVSYFERLRQLEEKAERIVILAGPISFLLASDNFETVLREVLRESVPEAISARERLLSDIDKILEILHQRKNCYLRRSPGIVNLISAMQIERFLTNGLVGCVRLNPDQQKRRRELARQEVRHLISLIEEESMGTQIGLVTDNLPGNGFMIFRLGGTSTLSLSPFRLGENPNVRVGVAMITSAPEAVQLHQNVVEEAWRTAIKGQAAAAYLHRLLDDHDAAHGRAPEHRLKLSK
jgi:transcriptional regulator with XRE-family HTH domain